MNPGKITAPFRKIGLMHLLDKAKFYYEQYKNHQENRAFVKQNPTLKLPPAYITYEAFRLNYRSYYEGGRSSAQWLQEIWQQYTVLEQKRILDWGCGPARIVRHLPGLLGPGCTCYGTDYNARTIAWCEQHIPGVHFSTNALSPPMAFADGFFDIIYGISILTHLSEENQQKWYHELIRILKPGGLLLLTTQGNVYAEKLTADERSRFRKGQLVTRGNVTEGHRVYATFHPPGYVQNLFSQNSTILEHREGKKENWGLNQDLWILRKR
jgi:SAM-dependent methyltransferase